MKTIKEYISFINEKISSIDDYINEKLKLSNVKTYNYYPKTKKELEELIHKLLYERGNNADLNDIDTSEITDMSELFKDYTYFDGDISKWNISKVKNMNAMFNWCKSFTGKGLEKWDVSNVKDMQWTFYKCDSLNCDLSNWKINKHCNLINTFYDCNITPDWWDDDWMQI